MKFIHLLYIAFTVFMVTACDLEQEINIDLPDFERGIVVECYLEPGKPFRLLMSNAEPYFAPLPPLDETFFDLLLADSAEVNIVHQGTTYSLQNILSFDTDQRKFFNYVAPQIVPANYNIDFDLNIVTKDGSTITATTTILEPITIDSVIVEFEDEPRNDTLFARTLTYFNDIPDQRNFFRRMVHVSSLDSIPLQDFSTDDRFVQDRVVFGTQFEFATGDTVFNTIFHLNEDHYNFLESTQNAVNGNFNPFGQPSPIISNLESDAENIIGIFTGLSFDQVISIIEE